MSRPASRRDLLGASGALLLLIPAAAGSAKAAKLDGDLLAACARFHAAFAAMEAPGPRSDAMNDQLCIAWDDALDEVAAMTPRTLEGVQARAHVALVALIWDKSPMTDMTWQEQASPCERLAINALCDMAGRAMA